MFLKNTLIEILYLERDRFLIQKAIPLEVTVVSFFSIKYLTFTSSPLFTNYKKAFTFFYLNVPIYILKKIFNELEFFFQKNSKNGYKKYEK